VHVNVLNEPEISIMKSFHIAHVTWLRLECRNGGCGDGDTLHTLQGEGWGLRLRISLTSVDVQKTLVTFTKITNLQVYFLIFSPYA
jgi:hypothetical protein